MCKVFAGTEFGITRNMEMRQLGDSNLYLSPLVFGGNVFGWTVNEKTAFELLDDFVDHGFNSIDTANSYSTWVPGNLGGESETIIGRWLQKSGKRKNIFIFTKVGSLTEHGKGLSEHQIIHQAEMSLSRLHTDYIDLYFSHKDDTETPLEETLNAYHKLIKEGKVRYIGASNFSGVRLREALNVSLHKGLPKYIAGQPRYNLYDRSYEEELQPYIKKHHIGVVTYSSLASGFLSGKYRSETDLANCARGKSVAKYLNEKGFTIIQKLEELSLQSGFPMASIALAWILKNPTVTSAIASATSVSQLNDLMKATESEIMNLPLDNLVE